MCISLYCETNDMKQDYPKKDKKYAQTFMTKFTNFNSVTPLLQQQRERE